MKNLGLFLVLSSLVGCVSTSSKSSLPGNIYQSQKAMKEWADYDEDYVDNMHKNMTNDLERSNSQNHLNVTVLPQTDPFLRISVLKMLYDEAYKRDWSDEVLDVAMDATKSTKLSKKTCFRFEAVSNTTEANDPDSWHIWITDSQGTQKSQLKKIRGFKEQKLWSTKYSSYITTDVFLYSDFCADRLVDFRHEVVVKISPRYSDRMRDFLLTWLPPKK